MFKTSYLRTHEHPYETRSKSFRKVKTSTDLIESFILSSQASDNSIIYLGSFRKSPQLITLEDSDESSSEKIVQPKKWINVSSRTATSFKVTHIYLL